MSRRKDSLLRLLVFLRKAGYEKSAAFSKIILTEESWAEEIYITTSGKSNKCNALGGYTAILEWRVGKWETKAGSDANLAQAIRIFSNEIEGKKS